MTEGGPSDVKRSKRKPGRDNWADGGKPEHCPQLSRWW